MCFRRSRYWEERAEEPRKERLWDLFYRETERSEPPVPIAYQDERSEQSERSATEREQDEVPAAVER